MPRTRHLNQERSPNRRDARAPASTAEEWTSRPDRMTTRLVHSDTSSSLPGPNGSEGRQVSGESNAAPSLRSSIQTLATRRSCSHRSRPGGVDEDPALDSDAASSASADLPTPVRYCTEAAIADVAACRSAETADENAFLRINRSTRRSKSIALLKRDISRGTAPGGSSCLETARKSTPMWREANDRVLDSPAMDRPIHNSAVHDDVGVDPAAANDQDSRIKPAAAADHSFRIEARTTCVASLWRTAYRLQLARTCRLAASTVSSVEELPARPLSLARRSTPRSLPSLGTAGTDLIQRAETASAILGLSAGGELRTAEA